jgi:NADH-quinone oxidoreductase subunit J
VTLLLILQVLLWKAGPVLDGMTAQSPQAAAIGTVEHIGGVLFTEYVFVVEITSVLLLAAMIGAVVLAKKQFP